MTAPRLFFLIVIGLITGIVTAIAYQFMEHGRGFAFVVLCIGWCARVLYETAPPLDRLPVQPRKPI